MFKELFAFFLLSTVFLTGCVEEKTVKDGDKVSVDYSGWTEGKMFDSSIEADAKTNGFTPGHAFQPLEFVVGKGQVIKGFDEALVGMREGDEKNVSIPPEKGYGEKSEWLVQKIDLSNVELGEKPPAVGDFVTGSNGARGKIISVNQDYIEVDFNNELAGKTLVFKIVLRKILEQNTTK